MRQEVVEAHAMAPITLDLERGGPALRRGDKKDQETTKKRRRQRPGGSKCEVGAGEKGGLVCQRARVCAYMAEPHVALGESWQVHLYGEAANFFFFFPPHLYGEATLKSWGAVLLYALVCGMTNQPIKREVGRGEPYNDDDHYIDRCSQHLALFSFSPCGWSNENMAHCWLITFTVWDTLLFSYYSHLRVGLLFTFATSYPSRLCRQWTVLGSLISRLCIFHFLS